MSETNKIIVFHKPPFTGWMIVILCLFACFYFLNQNDKKKWHPENLTKIVQDDFHKKNDLINNVKYDITDSVALQNTFTEIDAFQDIYVYGYINGKIKYWSGNIFNSDEIWTEVKLHPQNKILMSNNITAYQQKKVLINGGDTFTFIELIPISVKFSIESKQLRSKFFASSKIQPNTKVLEFSNDENAYPIRFSNNEPVFNIVYFDTDYYENSLWSFAIYYLALLLSALYILTKLSYYCRIVKYPVYVLLILIVLKVLYSELYKLGIVIPTGILNTDFHSPSVLGSDLGFNSFYHLLSDTLISTLILFFIIVQVPAKRFLFFPERFKLLNHLLLITVTIGLAYSSYYVTVQKIIVLLFDSKISFNVEKLKYINEFTFWGILVLILLTINFILILYFINSIIEVFQKNKLISKILVCSLFIAVMIIQYTKITEFIFITTLLLTCLSLFIINRYGSPFGLEGRITPKKNYRNVWLLWFTLISLWTTFQMFAYGYQKEIEIRKIYAQRQIKKQDFILEYSFKNIAEKVINDNVILNHFNQTNALSAEEVRIHILNTYLSSQFPDYEINVSLKCKNENDLSENFKNVLNENNAVLDLDKEVTTETLYRGLIPVNNKGGIFITFNPRSNLDLPEILRPQDNLRDFQFYDNYVTGIFQDDKLISQKSQITLPHNLSDYHVDEYKPLHDNLTYSDYYYQANNDQVVIIVRYFRNLIVSFSSLFSYSMLVFLCVWILIYIIRYYLNHISRNLKFRIRFNLSLRTKINTTIGITVFIAFVIVSISTYYLLSYRNKLNVRAKTHETINIAKHYLESLNFDNNNANIHTQIEQGINTLKADFNINANFYNTDGKLLAAANKKLTEENIIGNLIRPDILNDLKQIKSENLLFTEDIYSLSIPVVYTAITDVKENIIGYVSILKFSTIGELNNNFSDQLIALINIYIIIFFVASLAALIISNSIINSFNLLIQKFRDIRLKHNERIEWHHHDEIGLLVSEYNLMLERVEKLASKLAISEREATWREVAKQVAHEIKNPLTPIKLNIQYLQKAIQSGRDNVQELTLRISDSIIEQIENLNVIASAFSNFAKMPKASPELLEVNNILRSFVILFEKENNCEILYTSNQEFINIFIDKSQLTSVISNILKNAVQAIPKDKEGLIEIKSEVKNEWLTISIKDNGIGIPEEVKEKLFAPYFTTKHEGNGIGLYLCRIFIEEAGGQISFETFENIGTTFIIELPLHKENFNSNIN